MNKRFHITFGAFHRSQSGNATLIGAIAVAGASLIGIQVMMERTARTSKTVKMELSRDESAQLPRNAAILAKSLVSVPEGATWLTSSILEDRRNLPGIYPDPYYAAGTLGEPIAATAVGTIRLMDPPSNWNNLPWSGAQFTQTNAITIKTIDGSKIKNADFEDVMASPRNNLGAFVTGSGSTSSRYPMTPTTVSYTLKNCDNQGRLANSWTGQYCTALDLSYIDSVSTGTTSTATRAAADLGPLPKPPKPICGSVAVVNSVMRGTPIQLDIRASGVVIGYKVSISVDNTNYRFPDFKPQTSGPVYTGANQIGMTKSLGTLSVPTTGITSAQMPPNSDLTIASTITGADGEEVLCPVLRRVPVGTPSCVIDIYDDEIYSGESVGALLSRPHQNREIYIGVRMSNSGGYNARMSSTAVTHYDNPFGSDASGLVVPTDARAQSPLPTNSPAGRYMYKAVATGTDTGEYAIVVNILDPVTNSREASCTKTGFLAGQWIPNQTSRTCASICSGIGMSITFDRGGMSCLSGENYYSRAYASKIHHGNDVRIYYQTGGVGDALMKTNMTATMGSTWGPEIGDFELDNLNRPDVDRRTYNEGNKCYWLSRKTTYSDCAGTTNDLATPGSCQKFDSDPTDRVKACYCKK
jgi:hypothetical protein